MANTKISELPLFTGNTAGAYLVMNNSGQTTTFKVTRENIIGASGTSGTSGSSGAAGSSGTSGDSLFALTGSVWNTTNNVGITGSLTLRNTISNDITALNGGGITFQNSTGTIISSLQEDSLYFGSGSDFGTIAFSRNTLTTLANRVDISGSVAVSGSITSTSDSTFNSVVVGKAAGSTSVTNTRVGNNSLLFTGVGATGTANTAIGRSNLTNNSVGSSNTAIGASNLANNISGSFNTAIGASNLGNLRTGNENTSIGFSNLGLMATGSSTMAIGTSTLANYRGDGFNNMGIGPRFTLNRLESGAENIAIGSYAMQNVLTGSNNTIIGGGAFANMTGSNNIGLGYYAGTNLTGTVNNTLVIDSLLRTNYQNEGLIYGVMNGTVANQTLRLNAATTISNNTQITGSLNVSGSVNIEGPLRITGSNTFTDIILQNKTGNTLTQNYLSGPNNELNLQSGDAGASYLRMVNISGSIAKRILFSQTKNDFTIDDGTSVFFRKNNNITGSVPQFTNSLEITGSLNVTGSVYVTGSANITSVMTLAEQSTLPTGSVGSLAVSGSNLFYHNGSSWSQIN